MELKAARAALGAREERLAQVGFYVYYIELVATFI